MLVKNDSEKKLAKLKFLRFFLSIARKVILLAEIVIFYLICCGVLKTNGIIAFAVVLFVYFCFWLADLRLSHYILIENEGGVDETSVGK